MATAPKLPISHNSFLEECRAERELLLSQTRAQLLSMGKVIKQSEAVILDCETMLIELRSRRDSPQCTVCGLAVTLETAKADERGKSVHDDCYLLKINLHDSTLPPKGS